jgi:hypothetical protein
MAPRLHGNMAVQESVGYFEWWRHGVFMLTWPDNSGYHLVDIGSFTMPWRGTAFLDMNIDFGWAGVDGYQHVQATMQYTNPTPTNYSNINVVGSNQGGELAGNMPVYARWDDLAANLTVALTLGIYVGGGGPTASFYRISGSVRGMVSA